MRHSIKGMAAIAALAGGTMLMPLAAHADFAAGEYFGKTVAEISAALEKQGYTIKEIEVERREIEADVTKNDEKIEIHVDPATGKVVKIEKDH